VRGTMMRVSVSTRVVKTAGKGLASEFAREKGAWFNYSAPSPWSCTQRQPWVWPSRVSRDWIAGTLFWGEQGVAHTVTHVVCGTPTVSVMVL
jgi:hypothetical protein